MGCRGRRSVHPLLASRGLAVTVRPFEQIIADAREEAKIIARMGNSGQATEMALLRKQKEWVALAALRNERDLIEVLAFVQRELAKIRARAGA